MKNFIEQAIEETKVIKWHLLLKVNLEKFTEEREEEVTTRYFHSDTASEFTTDNVEVHLEEALSKIV